MFLQKKLRHECVFVGNVTIGIWPFNLPSVIATFVVHSLDSKTVHNGFDCVCVCHVCNVLYQCVFRLCGVFMLSSNR